MPPSAARAFGCARVVWNDCLRDRREAHAAGLPYVTSAELSRLRITQTKRTEERAWLADVSAVILQQSLRNLDSAYKNFFDTLRGKRQGRKVGPPRYKSKKDTRQSIRLNTNAFSIQKQRHGVCGQGRQPQGQVVPPTSGLADVSDRHEGQLRPVLPQLCRGHRARVSCAGRRRSSSAFSGSCRARPRGRRTGPRPASRSRASTPRWPTGAGTGTTRFPRKSFATTKRCMWKTSRCPPWAAPGPPSPCMTRDGLRSSACWSTRRSSTAALSPRWTVLSRPLRSVRPAASGTVPSRCTFGSGRAARAARCMTVIATQLATSFSKDVVSSPPDGRRH